MRAGGVQSGMGEPTNHGLGRRFADLTNEEEEGV